jgi:hypothetical protein
MSSQNHSDRFWRPSHPLIQWIMGALSTAEEWSGHEADHSDPFSDEFKNEWSYTSVPS